MDVPVRWIIFLALCLPLWASAEVNTTQTPLVLPPGVLTSKDLPNKSNNDICVTLGKNVRLNQQLTHVNSQLLNELTQMVKKNAEITEAAMQTVLSSTTAMAESSNLIRDLTLATQSNARAIADVIRVTQKNGEAVGVVSKFLSDNKIKEDKHYFAYDDVNIARRSVKDTENGDSSAYFTISLTEKMKEVRDNFLQKILPKKNIVRPSPSPTPLVITDEDLMPTSTPNTSYNYISSYDPLPTKTSILNAILRPVNPNVNIKSRSCVTGFLKSESNETFCTLRTGHTWAAALAWCESQGLTLAQPKDILAMSTRVQSQDSQSGRSWVYWLGGRGVGKNLTWLNGSTIYNDDLVWKNGHPGYSTSTGDCLAIQSSSFSHHGLLRAYSCISDNIYVICS